MKSSMKNTHWFPHPANLRNDRRMKRAMKDLPGGVGYGVIILIIEILRCEPKFQYPIADLDLLADEFDISLAILQTVITSYGFFEVIEDEQGKMFVSPVLNDLMIPYITKRKQNQIAGQISAQKRKLKQEQQLEMLRQLDSSQHMLDKCEVDVQQNKLDNSREKNKISLFTDFKRFKHYMTATFHGTGTIVCYGPAGFAKTTGIEITSQSYLQNKVTNQDLSIDDAKKVWKWMYENQDKLCVFGGYNDKNS